MKKISIIFLALSLCSGYVSANGCDGDNSMGFCSDECKVGTVPLNKCYRLMEATDVQTACGCFKPEISKSGSHDYVKLADFQPCIHKKEDFIALSKAKSVDACAELCNQNQKCGAFDYSNLGKCILLKSALPTRDLTYAESCSHHEKVLPLDNIFEWVCDFVKEDGLCEKFCPDMAMTSPTGDAIYQCAVEHLQLKPYIPYKNYCPGQCGSGKGECKCPEVWDPVCSTKGKTYGNKCKAECDDAVIKEAGECKSEECQCPEIWDPVCSKKGKTYGNKCKAGCDGGKIKHKGECQDTKFCPKSKPQLCKKMCKEPRCPENECALRRGSCCNYRCKKEKQASKPECSEIKNSRTCKRRRGCRYLKKKKTCVVKE